MSGALLSQGACGSRLPQDTPVKAPLLTPLLLRCASFPWGHRTHAPPHTPLRCPAPLDNCGSFMVYLTLPPENSPSSAPSHLSQHLPCSSGLTHLCGHSRCPWADSMSPWPFKVLLGWPQTIIPGLPPQCTLPISTAPLNKQLSPVCRVSCLEHPPHHL